MTSTVNADLSAGGAEVAGVRRLKLSRINSIRATAASRTRTVSAAGPEFVRERVSDGSIDREELQHVNAE